jgi:uncharacterized NAD(P)/FAD-binding protein YdhS
VRPPRRNSTCEQECLFRGIGANGQLSDSKFNVVIVGGGFSGTLLAVQLLRRIPNLSVAIIDKGSVPGRGLAYGTKYRCHLLNVPAGNMSALPEDPDHFLHWAQANYEHPVRSTSFLPRSLYGRYVGSLLEDAVGNSGADNFRWMQGEVCSLTRERFHVNVQLEDGRKLETQAVVLAQGNFPPGKLNIPGLPVRSERYVPSAWSATALQDIPRNGSVLLIGSGLTSLDLAVALKSDGFAGHIHILSRRGLMPQTHRQTGRWPQFWNKRCPRTARGLLRLVRGQIRAASEVGGDWRAVIDSLRSVTQELWQSLPHDERKRFLRHMRSYWEVHRHRIAPEIGATIADLIRVGQISLYVGRITSYSENHDHAEVSLRDRKTGAQQLLRVDRVINCTGPETDSRRINNPLIKSLLAQGLAGPDPLFIGLNVDEEGALIDSTGSPSDSLYVIGPARKGSLWETTAVPEIRTQVSQLAEHLSCRLRTLIDTDVSETAREFTAETRTPDSRFESGRFT